MNADLKGFFICCFVLTSNLFINHKKHKDYIRKIEKWENRKIEIFSLNLPPKKKSHTKQTTFLGFLQFNHSTIQLGFEESTFCFFNFNI